MTDSPPFKFAYRWHQREFIRAGVAVARHTRAVYVTRVLAMGLLVVTMAFAVLVVPLGYGDLALALVPWWILLAVWIYVIGGRLAWLQGRRYLKQHGGSEPEHAIELTEIGVRHVTPLMSAEFKWPLVRRIVETPEFLLFFYNWQCAVYLPKRVAGADALVALRDWLESHAGPPYSRSDRPRYSGGLTTA